MTANFFIGFHTSHKFLLLSLKKYYYSELLQSIHA